jgi:hypothetical protein
MPLVNRSDDEANKRWREVVAKYFEEKKRLEQEQKPKDDKIIELLEELKTKIDTQNNLLQKIASTISKMYQDDEIDKDTFNKLDEFLKPYYDKPYQQDSY